MEGEGKTETPNSDKGIWSPDVLIGSYTHSNGSGMTSTPYWPPSFKKLPESGGSSKQDSGYCSATPRSADSEGLLCRQCHRSLHHSYGQSSPSYFCSCDKVYNEGKSPNVECLEAIQEVKMSPTPKLPSRFRLNWPLDSYEDAMDTSLYPEEMEVDRSSAENHQCSLEISELGEEKSIDFLEPHVLSASQSSPSDVPINSLPSNVSSEIFSTEMGDSQKPVLQDCKFVKETSEDFFSPEIFNCDYVSPKIKNESTPTKSRKGNSPKKVKKGSSFKSSAKQITTMNRVLKSFFSLNGIETVDFLYQLGVKRNFQHVISRIFNFLPEKDLDSVRVVSKTWNRLLCSDSTAFNRWQQHCTAMRLMKENLLSPMAQGSPRERPALTQLHNIANKTSPQQLARSPPVSPSSVRFHSYQRAAKTLKKNERLLPCPRCRFPSTDRGSPVAQCPRSGCRHRFCVWCNIEVVSGLPHNCPPLYTPRSVTRRNSAHTIGSKSSKKNLRRL